jgi:hypothetical protein
MGLLEAVEQALGGRLVAGVEARGDALGGPALVEDRKSVV